ncbi:hypothetical protein SteCoe_26849 [Stentor coeruleus]|uniref:RING-type domain-containing protein n=1 Tax=Stentor coeruleus TaxID=5963 RepID=A0A1R2AW26_9CILI|nr:hypothetical protein SteCoe_33820 [Stentor coeruleus]OMJ74260.1 hypothetical protein SteCoe_26849 [Stentor coeruleus]
MDECTICCCEFVRPRVLSCGHTFCEKCIEKLIRNKKLKCPDCRFSHKDVTIDSFPLNFKLNDAIKEKKMMLEEKKKLEAKSSPKIQSPKKHHKNQDFINSPEDPDKTKKVSKKDDFVRKYSFHNNDNNENPNSEALPQIITKQNTEYLKTPAISKKLLMLSLLYIVPALILALAGLAYSSQKQECSSYLRYWHFSWCGSHLILAALFIINTSLQNYSRISLKIIRKIFYIGIFLIFLWTFVGIYWASDKCQSDSFSETQDLVLIIIVSLDFFFNMILFSYNIYIWIKRLIYERRAGKI